MASRSHYSTSSLLVVEVKRSIDLITQNGLRTPGRSETAWTQQTIIHMIYEDGYLEATLSSLSDSAEFHAELGAYPIQLFHVLDPTGQQQLVRPPVYTTV